jgi:hypothetical protein
MTLFFFGSRKGLEQLKRRKDKERGYEKLPSTCPRPFRALFEEQVLPTCSQPPIPSVPSRAYKGRRTKP